MAFPTTSVIDNFNRANEGPPMTGWSDDPELGGNVGLKVSSNTCVASGNFAKSWYSAATYGPDTEAYITVSTVVSVVLLARLATPGTSGADGYELSFSVSTNQLSYFRMDNTALTQLGGTDAFTALSSGDKCGFEIIGSTLTSYLFQSGAWSSVSNRSDSTYTAAGNVGLGVASTSGVTDDFGGGTAVSGPGPALLGQPPHTHLNFGPF